MDCETKKKKMKAEELRIGNYLDRNGLMEVCKIDGMSHIGKVRIYDHVNKVYTQHTFDLDSFQPIPLTEEWLLKFGFGCHTVENEARTIFYSKTWGINGVEIICRDYHYKDKFEYQIAKARYKELKYVHQLQNLYFAFTGEELTIK